MNLSILAPLVFLLAGNYFVSATEKSTQNPRRRLEPLTQDCTIVAIAYSSIPRTEGQDGRLLEEEMENDFDCIVNNQAVRVHFDSQEQKSHMNDMLESGEIISGTSILKHENIMVGALWRDSSSDTTADVEVFLPSDDSYVIETNASNRRLVEVTGDKPILAVRVTDSAGKVYPHSAEVMSDNIFGTNGDPVNLKSQMAACSFNKLKITTDYSRNIDDKLAATGIIEVTIPIPFNGSSKNAVRNAVTTAAQAKLGFTLPGPFQQVMYILENCYGDDCAWAAYAYVNSWMSVYKKEYYAYPGVTMHELGHNFGLAHSGGLDRQTYTDHTCLMGNPLWGDDIGRMCFNPAKNWQIGWYDDRKLEIDATVASLNRIETVVGIANYNNNPDNRNVIIKLESGTSKDFFVGFNRAIGVNEQNDEADNEVTIIETGQNGQSYSQSFLRAHLVQGESYTIEEIGVTVKAENIDLSSSPSTATILFRKGDISPTPAPVGSCPESSIVIDVTTDNYPAETSWELRDECDDTKIDSISQGDYTDAAKLHSRVNCVPTIGKYKFTISDQFGDGMCCSYGSGSFKVRMDGVEKASGGFFDYTEETVFGICTSTTMAPTIIPTRNPTKAPTEFPTTLPSVAPSIPPVLPPTNDDDDDGGNDDSDCIPFEMRLKTDDYPEETTWSVTKGCSDEVVLKGGPYNEANTEIIESGCLPLDSYTFAISDSHGDGICCGSGNGKYSVLFDDEIIAMDETQLQSWTLGNPSPNTFELFLTTDNAPRETSWQLFNRCTGTMEMFVPPGYYRDELSDFTITKCIPEGAYTFTMYDSNGDGTGFYSVKYGGETKSDNSSSFDGDSVSTSWGSGTCNNGTK